MGSVLTLLVALPLIPWRVRRIKLCNFYGHTVGRAVMWCAGATPVVRHPERLAGSMPAIYVANHTSTLDAFVSIWLCPYGGCGVFKKEIANIPFFGQLLRLSGHLMLDRQNKQKAVEALTDVAALVKRERLGIWIMPEGTRSKDGRLLRFKTGFVHLAIATGLPVVPVVLHGAHRLWPLGFPLFAPGPLEVDVLEPIDTTGWSEATSAEHAEAVRARLDAALRPDQRALPLPEAVAA
ncbi:MAG: 1-acyl-sn-glycerol-3-phosphate acyltransferase [Myxococcaceae bacterium]|nr:1-acyl-sn-glycerol-3-phosphate acyltransferase [Myxococcaceae bacterium]